MLRKELPGTADLGAAVEAMRRRLDVIAPGTAARLSEEIAEAHHVVASQFADIEVLHRHSVIRQRPPWYFGPTHGDLHWPAFEDYLIEAKRWAADDVKAIDDASKEVVSLLSDPNQDQFSCRGLVVGHVQSGKTANMTAVIAKALDAGYDTVVVLSGMTNKLRYQTQLRLVNDLVRRNPRSWQVHTPNEIDGDFRAPPYGGLLQHSDKSQLAVIKKNVSPLRELKKAVDKTYLKVLRGLRILVIDDECDQASVNSARRELDMTAINGRIRELLSCLPAVTYVGYTATPFANVLINPYRADGEELDDLYPRDFITALPKSERYFGAEELFGTMPSDPALVRPHEEAVDMIRNVPPEEEIRLQPRSQRGRDRFRPVMTESLETAILYFLVCCAARHVRGDNRQHMTMLVHTSAYVVAHERMAALIQGWLEVNGARITDGASDLAERIRNIWIEEQNRLPSSITAAARISADQLFECLPLVLDRIEVPIENGASEDRIDYGGEAKTYIVVGGSILARGLTLEGLMVSYFLRKANQYDTLLQMGRWFGYRPGYEDLPRIWMPEDLRLRFRALAVVEAEIRDEIEQYHKQNLTPEDIAVRIRAIPGMAITGVNKMRHARPCAVSYWGTHRQTFRFDHRDRELLRRNWEAGVDLINLSDSLKLRDRRAARTGRKLWRGVPVSTIRRFFERYAVHRHHRDLAADMLLPFLASGDPRLAKWNVGVVEAKGGRECPSPLGDAGRVKAVKRARMADSTSVADIKALMSKRDVLFDVDKEQSTEFAGWADLKAARAQAVGDVPLLLLYPIDRESAPQRSGGVRTSLDAAFDVLGYGIIFPGSVTEGGDYVSVELSPFSADELDAIDAEEAAQAEAAGVEGSRG
ncbi:MAG: Z1 domain-containing protein [Gemmatimonadota bacterium]|uniref:Z1 domain-containing protein n=1 Tax=Candidatus Palauibacter scopulicola TaxID=3056741 RepID=UPI00239A9793|nr:Z1 domain-containing protein [Candidatus Palauibacter scopulicola]MDE2663477.1 Z1 domain-containing protein [Candidatus Palauibacter scopulicola]